MLLFSAHKFVKMSEIRPPFMSLSQVPDNHVHTYYICTMLVSASAPKVSHQSGPNKNTEEDSNTIAQLSHPDKPDHAKVRQLQNITNVSFYGRVRSWLLRFSATCCGSCDCFRPLDYSNTNTSALNSEVSGWSTSFDQKSFSLK